MAGDWIKMRGNLWDDPRVTGIIDFTNSSEAMVIGSLYWLWSTADQHSSDGFLPGMSLKSLDRKTGLKGFGDALVDINWIRETPEGIEIIRFDDHNGESAKKRCQTAKRVSKLKSANAKVTQLALLNEDGSVSDALPREREREEKSKHLTTTTDNSTIEAPENVVDVVDVENENQAPMPEQQPPVLENTPAVALTVALRKVGVNVTSMHPTVQDWIAKGVTIPMAMEAVALARRQKPEPETIAPNYLNTILANMIKPKVRTAGMPLPEPKKWYDTSSGIESKGAELGIKRLEREDFPRYRARVVMSSNDKDAIQFFNGRR